MKAIKRITAIIMALAMIFALGVDVFAEDLISEGGPFTITVRKNSTDKAGHTYSAYQIFDGSIAKDATGKIYLSDIKWGSGVKETDIESLINELKTLDVDGTTPFSSVTYSATGDTSATQVAQILSDNNKGDKEKKVVAQKFADIVNKYLSETKVSATGEGTAGDVGTPDAGYTVYKITVENPGYYLIKDEDGTVTDTPSEDPDKDKRGAYTDFILEVIHSMSVDEKAEVPSVTKKIVDDKGENPTDENTANIGDVIHYSLKSKLPNDLDHYIEYRFAFEDELSKGLTFDKESVEVYVGETKLEKSEYEVFYYPESNKFKVVLVDVIPNRLDDKGKDVEVRYSATLNTDADLTDEGNFNKVRLEYSNNPNNQQNGTPNDENYEGPKGVTPYDEVKTYTHTLVLKKVDESGTILHGAKFKIKGSTIVKTIVKEGQYAENSAANPAYYELKDGTYTTDAPTGEHWEEFYKSDTKYELKQVTREVNKADEVEFDAFVDSKGQIILEGIGEGQFIIEELIAPNGYNMLKDKIAVNVTAARQGVDDGPFLGYTWGGNYKMVSEDKDLEDIVTQVGDGVFDTDGVTLTNPLQPLTENDNTLTFTVKNSKGIQLPETGGIGTTVFYIVGGALLIAALALLVSKMLASSKKSAKSRAVSENI